MSAASTARARRPAMPPALCRFCGKPTERGSAHEECKESWQSRNVPSRARQLVFKRDGYRCADCGKVYPERWLNCDHDVPLASGGTNDLLNLVTRCKDCHGMKTATENRTRNQGSSPVTKFTGEPKRPDVLPAVASAAIGILAIGSFCFAGHVAWTFKPPLRLTSQDPWIYLKPGVIAVLLAASLAYAAAYWRYARADEAFRVFSALARVTGDSGAARKDRFRAWPFRLVALPRCRFRPGPLFTLDEDNERRLCEAFAAAIQVDSALVRLDRQRRGWVRLYVGELPRAPIEAPGESDWPTMELLAEPDTDDSLREALGAVLDPKAEVDVSVTRRAPSGQPAEFVLEYPTALTEKASEVRLRLTEVVRNLYPPFGEWSLTWESQGCRFVFADRPDPLAKPVPLPPIDPDVDPAKGVVLGIKEDGQPWRQQVLGTHVLMAGSTGTGKSGIAWGLIRGLSPLIVDGRCQLWAIDPKGGMELGILRPVAHFALISEAVKLLTEAVRAMEEQARRLSEIGARVLSSPSVDFPMHVILIDEFAALTAYADRKTIAEINRLVGLLLSQGRAAGFVVIGALQDPRAETLKQRLLFPHNIALRLKEGAHVDMVLGQGARARGAACDRIRDRGVGYVVENDGDPVRVRGAYVDDHEVDRVVAALTGQAPEPELVTASAMSTVNIDPTSRHPAYGNVVAFRPKVVAPEPTSDVPDVEDSDGEIVLVRDLRVGMRVWLEEHDTPCTIKQLNEPDPGSDTVLVEYQPDGDEWCECNLDLDDVLVRVR